MINIIGYIGTALLLLIGLYAILYSFQTKILLAKNKRLEEEYSQLKEKVESKNIEIFHIHLNRHIESVDVNYQNYIKSILSKHTQKELENMVLFHLNTKINSNSSSIARNLESNFDEYIEDKHMMNLINNALTK